jgi:hypothetical protein
MAFSNISLFSYLDQQGTIIVEQAGIRIIHSQMKVTAIRGNNCGPTAYLKDHVANPTDQGACR